MIFSGTLRGAVYCFCSRYGGERRAKSIADLESLRREIHLYAPRLSERPWFIVANKMDLPEAEENLRDFKKRFPQRTIVVISAKEGRGINELKRLLEGMDGSALRACNRSVSGRGPDRLTIETRCRTSNTVSGFAWLDLRLLVIALPFEAGNAAHLPAGYFLAANADLRHDEEDRTPQAFPFDDIELIPRPHRNLLRHGWMKFVERRPPLIYRGEYQMLVSILALRGADTMHIYFGHTGVHLLPFIREWNRPCLVSFHGADVAIKQDVENYVKIARSLRFRRGRSGSIAIAGRSLDQIRLPAGKDSNQSHRNSAPRILPGAAGISNRRPLANPASLPVDRQERRRIGHSCLCDLCAGISQSRIHHRGQGAAATGIASARAKARRCWESAFLRFSQPIGSTRIFTDARIFSFIQAKRHLTKIRKECRIPFSRRWRLACR